MAEIAPSGGGPNRLFVVLAIGLAGLLILGLLAVGGFLLIPRLLGSGAAAPTVRAALTPTRQIVLATVAPTSTTAPTEVATPTLVNASSGTLVAQATQSATETPTGGQLPQSGLGEDMLLLAGGVVLVMVVFAARRARTA